MSARWTLDPVDAGNVRIHSVWKPDEFFHLENGDLEAGPIQPDLYLMEAGYLDASVIAPD